MKNTIHYFVFLMLLLSTFSYAQKDLSNYTNIDGVFITSHWGDITIQGTQPSDARAFSLTATHTDTSQKPMEIKDYSKYLTFQVVHRKLYIETKAPKGFESVDIQLNIPRDVFLELKLIKGGNIYANDLSNGIEVNILNGSVKLENIGKYAFVNAANGEVDVQFSTIDEKTPISLVTMNGGVSVTLPKKTKRDIRLISRKNGYVTSDFELESDEAIINYNIKKYAKQPILNTAQMNGGGALLFLSTENGPIAIHRLKS